MLHRNSTLNHKIENWTYASATARTSATGFEAGDIGKLAYQTDNQTYWRLSAVTPTWIQVMAGPAGADGATGSVWRNGSGVPSNGLGINGDYYVRTSNGDVYFKAAGAYSVILNITGPAGANGADGADGVDATGPTGGTAGQVLAKIDATDFNTHWVTPSGGDWKQHLRTVLVSAGNFAITGVPTTYRHMKITITGTGVSGSPVDEVEFSSFSFSGGKWLLEEQTGAVATASNGESASPGAGVGIPVGSLCGDNAGRVGSIVINIPEYSATRAKTFTVENVRINSDLTLTRRSYWSSLDDTGACTDFDIKVVGSTFRAGTILEIELSGS